MKVYRDAFARGDLYAAAAHARDHRLRHAGAVVRLPALPEPRRSGGAR